ncbi:MAG: glutamine synthetase family protein [Granulosicoccaceae bacterium]
MSESPASADEQLQQWFAQHPDIERVQVAICDLNGLLRGKLIPREQAEKLGGGVRMPLSAFGIDIWGEDVIGAEQVFETGDGDGVCEFTGRGPLPLSWLESPSALVPLWMLSEDGSDSTGDPRRALARVVEQYKQVGLTPVVATELEFYLFDAALDEAGQPQPPSSPISGRPSEGGALYSLDELEAYEQFLSDVYRACEEQGIAADAAIAENGNGQFEINLLHVDDPLRAADDAMLFKRLVKGIARSHGYRASFMAKPYGERSGNGMHLHFSVLDKDGQNIFDDGGEQGTNALRHAVAGCLAAAAQSTLIFAPHLNSYRRLRPNTHAPIAIGWGYENRTALVRIPGGSHKARRIEHRAAGADSNPYLVIAAVLGAALLGMEQKMRCPPAIEGDAYTAGLESLPLSWQAALDAFSQGGMMEQVFNSTLRRMLIGCKEQEIEGLASMVSDQEIRSYLDAV